MTALFLLGLAAAAQQPTDTAINARIEAHPAVIPALVPYVECLNQNQARLSQRAGPLRSDGMRRVVEQAREHCARSRASARRRALQLIARDRTVAASERQHLVDAGFASVDASDETFLREVARLEQPPAPPLPAVPPPNIAVPNMARPTGRLDIPDEIAPAVVPYFACLSGRINRRGAEWMSSDRRSPPTPSNEEIVRACEADRARASSEGERLLGQSGERDVAARRARVERTLRDIETFLTNPPAPPRAGER